MCKAPGTFCPSRSPGSYNSSVGEMSKQSDTTSGPHTHAQHKPQVKQAITAATPSTIAGDHSSQYSASCPESEV